MDYIFPYDSPGDIFWFGEPEVLPVFKQSTAFVKYISDDQEFPREFALGNGYDDHQSGHDHRNMNKRMIDFLKRNPVGRRILEDSERERGRRHMISERVRREKQKNSYLALHSILPPKTKNDKNSIIQVAAKKVEELKSLKEELERQNNELERRVLDAQKLLGERKDHGAKIKLKVDYPSSGIDSMLEVLKCLKDKGSNTRAIHSLIATEQFSAVIDIETEKIEAAEVEEAIHRTLYEAERKFRFPYTYR